VIVFDVQCSTGHIFEGWFGSTSDYDAQRRRHLIACPYCGDTSVDKAVMAPNVGAKSNRHSTASNVPVAKTGEPSPAEVKAFLATMAQAQAKMLATSEWVGRDFDRAARAMDAGEIDKAVIHGEVTPDEAKALIDDEIAVLPLPFPVTPRNKQN
jgi:hypothetical protein